MVTATRIWSTRSVCPVVAPLGDDQSWEESYQESRRRMEATKKSFELNANVVERAHDFLFRNFPDCGDELAALTDEAIVEMYLDL